VFFPALQGHSDFDPQGTVHSDLEALAMFTAKISAESVRLNTRNFEW
jgi:hypothetical protein